MGEWGCRFLTTAERRTTPKLVASLEPWAVWRNLFEVGAEETPFRGNGLGDSGQPCKGCVPWPRVGATRLPWVGNPPRKSTPTGLRPAIRFPFLHPGRDRRGPAPPRPIVRRAIRSCIPSGMQRVPRWTGGVAGPLLNHRLKVALRFCEFFRRWHAAKSYVDLIPGQNDLFRDAFNHLTLFIGRQRRPTLVKV